MLDKLKAWITSHPLETLGIGMAGGAVLTYLILKFLKKVK